MVQTPEVNEYDKQAAAFLEETKTEFKVEFLEHGPHFDGEKERRDRYHITLKRGERGYSFDFGQSLKASGRYIAVDVDGRRIFTPKTLHEETMLKASKERPFRYFPKGLAVKKEGIVPNPDFTVPRPYDVLAAVTKHDPGTFEDFCADFGYDEDSRKAEGIYQAVRDEFLNIERLFNEREMEMLREIQ